MTAATNVVVFARFAQDALRARLAQVAPALAVTFAERFRALEPVIVDADVLVMAGRDWSAELATLVRERAARLRMIQLLTAGYERLEELGAPPGVVVANAGDAWSPTVAEHAIASMLALLRQLPAAFAAQRERRWDGAALMPRIGSASGRTLVIVGYGSIGREAALRARAFGMTVIGVSRSARADALLDEAFPATRLHDALARADVVLVAVPSGAATRRLFDAATLAACRPGALLVNVARGDIVDPVALRDALVSGRLGGAAIDVADPEPLPPGDPLWDAPNLLVTPHVAGFSGAAGHERLAVVVAANVARFARGDAPSYRVLA